jgi:diguanylate cyclase (GGDEF)-like protein/PAS domain S-box-containing protein
MPEFESPEIYRTVLETLQTGVYMVDKDLRILFWNDGAEKITGYLSQDVVGAFCRDQLIASDQHTRNVLSDAAASLSEVLREGKPSVMDVSLRHKAGHRIFVRLRAVPIRNSRGTIIGAAESIEEDLAASDWNRRQDKLADYGCLDPATGVLHQRFVLSHLREALATYAEHRLPFGAVLIEIDRLDHLRATYGAAVIAAVLRVAAQTLENSLRPTDFLGRYGDHRFLAVLTECGESEIERVCERLKKMVASSEVQWWGDQWSITSSIGGTTARQSDTIESILERLEAALGESLQTGGNKVSVSLDALPQ